MKHVSLLIPRGIPSVVNIAGAYQILNEVNGFMAAKGKGPSFDVQLVGLDRVARQDRGTFVVNPDILIDEIESTDLIVIPAVHDDPRKVLENNRDLLPWIVERHRRGADVASFCVGAFLLAGTGLLRGKQCTTHWNEARAFRMMYPDVNLVDEKILTEDDGIFTSGGAYSWLNLLVYLIEKYAGREIAILAAKSFMIDIDRCSQNPFLIFQGQRDHGDQAVRLVQDEIETHIGERLAVYKLADRVAVGRRSLERRFLKATGNTIAVYIHRAKIEAAKKHLETGRESILDVMYGVGFVDISD
jgi:transcriptional regulator GlxA family with amidase domain